VFGTGGERMSGASLALMTLLIGCAFEEETGFAFLFSTPARTLSAFDLSRTARTLSTFIDDSRPSESPVPAFPCSQLWLGVCADKFAVSGIPGKPGLVTEEAPASESRFAKEQSASELSSAAQSNFQAGRWNYGIHLGFGFGIPLGPGQDTEIEDVRLLKIAPVMGVQLTSPIGDPERWYHGNFELFAEGAFIKNFAEPYGYYAGVDVLLRYHFLDHGRWVPFIEGGVGYGYLDMDLHRQTDRMNFSPQIGGGFHRFFTRSSALTVSARLHHISNSNLGGDNRGINNLLIVAGWTVFF